jgi:hypothetical protein
VVLHRFQGHPEGAGDLPVAELSLPCNQSSLSGGAGGPPISHACSASMSGPGFCLERGNARLLVNSKPVMALPACSAIWLAL